MSELESWSKELAEIFRFMSAYHWNQCRWLFCIKICIIESNPSSKWKIIGNRSTLALIGWKVGGESREESRKLKIKSEEGWTTFLRHFYLWSESISQVNPEKGALQHTIKPGSVINRGRGCHRDPNAADLLPSSTAPRLQARDEPETCPFDHLDFYV